MDKEADRAVAAWVDTQLSQTATGGALVVRESREQSQSIVSPASEVWRDLHAVEMPVCSG
jgi:hypothetical protein